MDQDIQPSITATIVVEHHNLFGVSARVNGRLQHFPDLKALFRAAVLLAERNSTPEKERMPT